jgi:hypothetical protein
VIGVTGSVRWYVVRTPIATRDGCVDETGSLGHLCRRMPVMPASTLPLFGALLAALSVPHPGQPPVRPSVVRHEIVHLRQRVLRVRDHRGRIDLRVRRARLHGSLRTLLLEELYWKERLWRMRHSRPIWRRTPRWKAWMCIHGKEAAWNDPNAPYWGGLQMDLGFQRTYGRALLSRYGTADHWPMGAQVAVAERAYRVRRFTPWPNTARACGVL